MTKTNKASASTGNIPTLLVVEDEILIRFQICAYLRECGFRVIETVNADEAIRILKEPALRVDLVLSNAGLPGAIDGHALAQWIGQEKPALPVILAATPEHTADVAATVCEAGPMVAKPYEQQILLDRIRRTLADGG